VTDLDGLWSATFRELAQFTRHDFRGALNGVEVNLEVVRSRMAAGKTDHESLAPFLDAATQQMQHVTERGEGMYFLVRVQLGDAAPDVAVALKHLAAMTVPAAKGKGVQLEVSGYEGSVATSAQPKAIALALASGLLALIKEGGGGRCTLERGSETVVRFSHQSATACSLGPEVTATIAADGIRVQDTDGVLTLVFPKSR
jgi:hypothetical protein